MNDRKQRYRDQLGHSIQSHRRATGMHLREFAAMVGVNHAHLWNIEHGRTGVTIDALVKIADGLELKVHDLIDF